MAFLVIGLKDLLSRRMQIVINNAIDEPDVILCSVFALLSLHLFMYGCNLFLWKGTRINYNFIFEFQPSTSLKYRDAFLIGTTFMTSVVAAMVIHLLLRASGFSPNHVDAIPGILLLVSVTGSCFKFSC